MSGKICKNTRGGTAPGYWGGDINKRVESELIPEKIKGLLADKLLARGKDVFLWQQVYSDDPTATLCSCVKETTDSPDVTCSSCYGTKYIPGYLKFAHETLYLASIDSNSTLTNTIIDTNIKPHRILLNGVNTTGTIQSVAIPFINASNFTWEFKLDAANITNTNTISVEFSTDNITYYPITEVNDTGKQPVGFGNIYFRITLTRANATDRSPEFEILRLRHKNVSEPYIKILRPQVTEIPTWMQYGIRTEHAGERFWTLPLDFFDATITPETPEARILENSFYERVNGININIRYVTTRLSYNEEFGLFTQQSFDARRSQPEEVYKRLVF